VRKPIAVKIAPDLDDGEIESIARLALEHRVDALIATNTTIARDGIGGPLATQAGGSAAARSSSAPTAVLAKLAAALGGACP
jgi:dihydroorotate dehydrogenase